MIPDSTLSLLSSLILPLRKAGRKTASEKGKREKRWGGEQEDQRKKGLQVLGSQVGWP